MTNEEVIERIKSWLQTNVETTDLEWNLRIDSRNLLEYINKWENE
tara:strand:- start:839 stop:973 length:135 start_codon:yes stop_codon:yes gene_type:complete